MSLYADALNVYKREYIRVMLARHGGNQRAAARQMGIHRNTLSRQCAVLGIDWKEFAPQGSAGDSNHATAGALSSSRAFPQTAGTKLASPRRATFAPRKSGEARRTA